MKSLKNLDNFLDDFEGTIDYITEHNPCFSKEEVQARILVWLKLMREDVKIIGLDTGGFRLEKHDNEPELWVKPPSYFARIFTLEDKKTKEIKE
jgi:hypothetical protein